MAASLKGVDIFEFLTTLGKNVLDEIAAGNVKSILKPQPPTEIQFVEDLEPTFGNPVCSANRVSQRDWGGQEHAQGKRQCDDTSGDGWPAADSGWETMDPSSGWDDAPKLDSGKAKVGDSDGWGSSQVSTPARKPRVDRNVKWNAKMEGSGGCSSIVGWDAADRGNSGWGTMHSCSGWDDVSNSDSGWADGKDSDGWGTTRVSTPLTKPRVDHNIKWNEKKERSGGRPSIGWDAAERVDSGWGTMHSCSGWVDAPNSDSGWAEGKDSDRWGTTGVNTPPTKPRVDHNIKLNEKKELSGECPSSGWDAAETEEVGCGLGKVGRLNMDDMAKEDASCGDECATMKSPGGWASTQSAGEGADLHSQGRMQNDGNKQDMSKKHASTDNGWVARKSPAGWGNTEAVDTGAHLDSGWGAGMDEIIANSEGMAVKKASCDDGWGASQSGGWGRTQSDDGWGTSSPAGLDEDCNKKGNDTWGSGWGMLGGCNNDIADDESKDQGIQKARSRVTRGNNINGGKFEGLGDGVNESRRGKYGPSGSNLVPVGDGKGRSRSFQMGTLMDDSNERRRGKFGPSGSNLVPLGEGRGRARAAANKGNNISESPRYHKPSESDRSLKKFKHGGEESSWNDGWGPLGDDQQGDGGWGSSKQSQNVGGNPSMNNREDDGWGSSKHSGWEPSGDDGWGSLSQATASKTNEEDGWGGNASGNTRSANRNGTACAWPDNAASGDEDRWGGNSAGKQMNRAGTSTNEDDCRGGNASGNTASPNENGGSTREAASGCLGNAASNEGGNSNGKSTALTMEEDGLGGNARGITASATNEEGNTRETASGWLCNAASANEDGWGGDSKGDSKNGWGASPNEEDGWGGNARGKTASAANGNGCMSQTASGNAAWEDEDGWGGNSNGKSTNGWSPSASKDGWGSKQNAERELRSPKPPLQRWPSSSNRSSAFANNHQRPTRPGCRKESFTPGMPSPQNRTGHSQQVRDLMSLPQLSEVSELHKMMNRLLHHSDYKDGDRLKQEDEREVVEKVLVHHPDKDAKLAGLDYLMISTHSDHNARCFFVVHKDGSQTDFSYWKCLKSLIQTKFPELAKDFSAA